MALIKVRVGAQLDPSAVNIFKPLIAAAAQARAKIASEGKAGASEFVGGYRTAPAAARKGFDEVAVAAEKSAASDVRCTRARKVGRARGSTLGRASGTSPGAMSMVKST